MKKYFVLFALLVATAATTSAQTAAPNAEVNVNGKGKPKMEKRGKADGQKLKTDLGLTDDQAAKMKAIGDATKGKLQAIRADQATGKDQKRAQLKQINEENEAAIKGILTADQFTKFQTLKKERRDKMKENRGKGKQGGKEDSDGK